MDGEIHNTQTNCRLWIGLDKTGWRWGEALPFRKKVGVGWVVEEYVPRLARQYYVLSSSPRKERVDFSPPSLAMR